MIRSILRVRIQYLDILDKVDENVSLKKRIIGNHGGIAYPNAFIPVPSIPLFGIAQNGFPTARRWFLR